MTNLDIHEKIWDLFAIGKYSIYCNTEDEYKKFLYICEKNGIKISNEYIDWCPENRILYYCKDGYLYSFIAKPNIFYCSPCQIPFKYMLINYDYHKEYTLNRVFDFPEGTKFKCLNHSVDTIYIVREIDSSKTKFLEYKHKSENKELPLDSNSITWKFKLVQQEKQVNFTEAFDYNEVRVEHEMIKSLSEEYSTMSCILNVLSRKFKEKDIKDIIENGKWFVKVNR